ncbi:MAG: hypothetical protein JWO37_3075 [Acidimicrobiales bacterium]|jgi:hypothetical protein|nr:hypothetical protein [Acidimicrobiales bacterium]
MRISSLWARRPKKTGRALVMTALIGGLVVVGQLPASAVHDDTFQLDGNTVVGPDTHNSDSSTTQNLDWESFFKASTSPVTGDIVKNLTLPDATNAPGYGASGAKADYVLPDETVYATGSKDTLNISSGWQCKKANNVGDKVDIVNAYAAAYTAPNGDFILYFGMEKSSPNGDSNIAMWFLKDGTVDCDSTSGTKNFTGDHQDGDLLVVSAFTNGGLSANVAAYKWSGGANGHLDTSPSATGGTCGPSTTPDPADQNACAITNSTASITPPWNHPDKDGGALNPLEFFEGGVNLTAAGLGSSCFATFVGDTRSSQSPTATIFDFARGSLGVCRPSTTLSLTVSPTTVYAGQNVTISVTETNDGNRPLASPTTTTAPASHYVSLSGTADISACPTQPADVMGSDADAIPASNVTHNVGDLNNNDIMDAGEAWQFACGPFAPSSGGTIIATGHGIDTSLNSSGLDVTYCTSGPGTGGVGLGTGTDAGKLCDLEEQQSVTLTRIAPATELIKTASAAITYTYTEHNSGNAALDQPNATGSPISATDNGGWVVDNNCSAVKHVLGVANATDGGNPISDATHNVGDIGNGAATNNPGANNNKLDPGETWTFTCTATLAGPTGTATSSSVKNIAVGHGKIPTALDANNPDVTSCYPLGTTTDIHTRCSAAERDVVTVTIDYGDQNTAP